MSFRIFPLLAAAAALAAVSCQALRNRNVAPAGEWIPLWSGGEPRGWKMAGPGGFVVEEGALRSDGGMGLLWYAERPFRDLELELEWMVEEPTDNSGVFLRFPDPGGDPLVAVHHGYEVQICDTADPGHNTGSIYSFQAPRRVPLRRAGEWNRMAITARGQHYTVAVNGTVVNEFTGERGVEGYIGLQNHDPGSVVRYRGIRVREL